MSIANDDSLSRACSTHEAASAVPALSNPLESTGCFAGRLTYFGFSSCTLSVLPSLLTMATLLPPPKRQKVYHGISEPEPEAPKPSPHIVVQFVSEDDGQPLAPAVNLPANVSREGLEVIVNKLNTQVR